MRKWTKVMVMAALALAVVSAVHAQGFKASIKGSFVGVTGSYTNIFVDQGIAAIFVSPAAGAYSSATNSKISMTVPSSGTYILAEQGVTNTIAWVDQSGGIKLEKSGVISFYVGSSAVETNLFYINTVEK